MGRQNQKQAHNNDIPRLRRRAENRGSTNRHQSTFPVVGGALQFAAHQRKQKRAEKNGFSPEGFSVSSPPLESSVPLSVSSLLGTLATSGPAARRSPGLPNGLEGSSGASLSPSWSERSNVELPQRTSHTVAPRNPLSISKSINNNTGEEEQVGGDPHSDSPRMRKKHISPVNHHTRTQKENAGTEDEVSFTLRHGRRPERSVSPDLLGGQRVADGVKTRKKNLNTLPSSSLVKEAGSPSVLHPPPSLSSRSTIVSLPSNSKMDPNNMSGGTSISTYPPPSFRTPQHGSPNLSSLQEPSHGSTERVRGGSLPSGDILPSPHALAPLPGSGGGGGGVEEGNRVSNHGCVVGSQGLYPLFPLACHTSSSSRTSSGRGVGLHGVHQRTPSTSSTPIDGDSKRFRRSSPSGKRDSPFPYYPTHDGEMGGDGPLSSNLSLTRASSCSASSNSATPLASGAAGRAPDRGGGRTPDTLNTKSTSTTHPKPLNTTQQFSYSSPASLIRGCSKVSREQSTFSKGLSQDLSRRSLTTISLTPCPLPSPICGAGNALHHSPKRYIMHRNSSPSDTGTIRGREMRSETRSESEDGGRSEEGGRCRDKASPSGSPVIMKTRPINFFNNEGGSTEGASTGEWCSAKTASPRNANTFVGPPKKMTNERTSAPVPLSPFTQGWRTSMEGKTPSTHSPSNPGAYPHSQLESTLSNSLSLLPIELRRSHQSSSFSPMNLSVFPEGEVLGKEANWEDAEGNEEDQDNVLEQSPSRDTKIIPKQRETQGTKQKEERKGGKKLRVGERKELNGKGMKGEKKRKSSNIDDSSWEEGRGIDTSSYIARQEEDGSNRRSPQFFPFDDVIPMERAGVNGSPAGTALHSGLPFPSSSNEECIVGDSPDSGGNRTGKYFGDKDRGGTSKKSFRSSASASYPRIPEPEEPLSPSCISYNSPTAWCIPLTPKNAKSRSRSKKGGGGMDLPKGLGGSSNSTISNHGTSSSRRSSNRKSGGGCEASFTASTPGIGTKNGASGGSSSNSNSNIGNGTWRYIPSPFNQRTFYFPEDHIEFSSEFDSGNLIQVERVGAFRYNVYTAMDCANTPEQTNNRQWFYFAIRGVTKGGAMIVNVVGLMHCKMFTFDWMPVIATRPGKPVYQRLPGKAIVSPLEHMPPTPGFPNLVYKMRDDLDDSMTDFHPPGLHHPDISRSSLGLGDGPMDDESLSFSTSLHSGTTTGSAVFPGSGLNGGGHHSLVGNGFVHHANSPNTTFGTAFPPLAGRPGKQVLAGRKKKKKDFLAMSLAFEIRFENDVPLKSPFPLGHPNCPAVYIASNHPYSYDTLQRNIATWEVRGQRKTNVSGSPVGMQSAPYSGFLPMPIAPLNGVPIYFHREVLCQSLDGLNVDLLVITDRTGMKHDRMPLMCTELGIPYSSAHGLTERPHNFEGKVAVVLTARVHPGECPSSHMMHGCIEFLLHNTDPRAACLRQKCIFFIVPMINPDGVVRGHSRADALGVDLNRMYREPSFSQHPAPYCIRLLLNRLAADKQLGLYIDMHAHANKKGTFFYGNSMPPAQQIPALLYAKLVALNSPYFEFSSCNFTETNMYAAGKAGKGKDSSGRVVVFHDTGLPLCFTIEASHVAGKTFSPIAAVPTFVDETQETQCSPNSLLRYNPSSFADTGRGLLLAFLDLRGWNPISRIPFGIFHSVRGVTLWLQRQLHMEMAERILLQGPKGMNIRTDTSDSSLMLQSILSTMSAEDIPDKLTIKDSRCLPPITMQGVREFLSLETVARALMQTVTSGIPRSLVCNGPPRRGNGGNAALSLGSPKTSSSPIHFHDLL